MSLLDGFRRWRERRRQTRLAHRTLLGLFDDPECYRGTSLRPAHRGRVDLVDFEADGDEISVVRFTILRHPRPYPFSRQFHAVMQLYRYDVREQKVEHEKSLNLSRLHGRDGEPPGH